MKHVQVIFTTVQDLIQTLQEEEEEEEEELFGLTVCCRIVFLMRHGKDFGSQCGYLCVGTDCTVLSDFLAFTKSRAHPVPRRHKLPHKHKKRPISFDFCSQKLCKEATTSHRNESATLSMQDQRSAVEGLAV